MVLLNHRWSPQTPGFMGVWSGGHRQLCGLSACGGVQVLGDLLRSSPRLELHPTRVQVSLLASPPVPSVTGEENPQWDVLLPPPGNPRLSSRLMAAIVGVAQVRRPRRTTALLPGAHCYVARFEE